MLAFELETLSNNAELVRELKSAANGRNAGHVSLGVVVGERRFVASLDDDGEAGERDDMIALGCLMKLLTASLVVRIAGTPSKWRNTALANGLPIADYPALSDVKFGHLLDHTHGLDDSLIWKLPRAVDGSLDGGALCSM